MSNPKIWFITGCSSGIGRALAEQTAASGHIVVATARKPEDLEELKDSYSKNVMTLGLDVNDKKQISEAVDSAVNEFGKIDVVVNNAGYGLVGALEEYTDEQMQSNFETNFWSAINIIRKVLPVLRKQKSGHIVNISAGAAIMNEPGLSIYSASKAALDLASEALCWELKPLGIKVTNVVPGPFRTDFIKRSLIRADNRIEDYEQSSGRILKFLEKIDGTQPGDPNKAAEAILKIVATDSPPLYLYLGGYAYKSVNRKIKVLNRYLEDWEELGLNTDFDEVKYG